MVGNDAQRNIALGISAVLHAHDVGDVLHDVLNGIDEEQVIHTLHDAGKTLQSHARIDIGMVERCVIALAVVLKLGEYEVPDLDKAVALAADVTVGLAAAVLIDTVKIDFGAGTAGT